MRTYEKYKDSGISWIGKVPEDWDICKFKHTINIRNGKDYKDVQSDNHNDYPVYGSGGVFAYAKKYLYDGEALLLGRKGTIDKPIYIRKGKFWTVDTMFYGLATNGNVCKYLYYQALTFPFGRYATSTALPSMTQSDLGNNPICLPPIPEQEAIANYLDKKTAEIDKIIAEREKKIELLNELKSSIISRAVTKGINPHAKMKDSGIDWIGEIPEDWEVGRLKDFSTITLGKMLCSAPPENMQNDYTLEYYLKSRNIGDLRVHVDVVDKMWFSSTEKEIYKLHDGDIVMNEGGDIGKIGLWSNQLDNCYIQNSVHKITVNSDVYNKYLLYWLKYASLKLYFWSIVSQISIAHLTKEKISNTPVVLPVISQQREIANFIDKKINMIDRTISAIKKECVLYKEYKQSLISEVVTGKRKVID